MAGLAMAFTAWMVGVAKFDTPSTVKHKQIGIAVMVIGLLQPLNAFVRPSKEVRDTKRKVWEFVHLNAGRAVIVIAAINMFSGLHQYDDIEGLSSSWGFVVLAWDIHGAASQAVGRNIFEKDWKPAARDLEPGEPAAKKRKVHSRAEQAVTAANFLLDSDDEESEACVVDEPVEDELDRYLGLQDVRAEVDV
ncbi:hypothetical protein CYMTET_18161 [Cymbomonas tetramitiformis]|uniref:Cytochrome b561 domain-containing protein n=1 Tax=Cymbomonas tetramitiformis TaxID=36881 RepID=A0AAE0G988_9CHLO|nr:hypothetical protein CYMTET_18161 [Cymbomonas tetramitiformis]